MVEAYLSKRSASKSLLVPNLLHCGTRAAMALRACCEQTETEPLYAVVSFFSWEADALLFVRSTMITSNAREPRMAGIIWISP